MSSWRIERGDCLDVMARMDANSVDAVVTDPPYYKVKGEDWDRQWDNPAKFLEWIGQLCEQWQRILKPNGSLYVFASPKMSARVECKIGEWFNVIQRICWAKPPFATKAEMFRKADLRSYFPATEYIIFAEHYGADNIAKGEAGYGAKCDELRGFVFEPLRAYLDGERRRAGFNFEMVRQAVGCADGSGLPSHWFTQSQWMLPTTENYDKLRAAFNAQCNSHGPDHLRREYEDLRREYEDLRREYEDLRRPFSVTADVPYTDVWEFPTVADYPGKHPCEKPSSLIAHIIHASTREGDIVLDCFSGSGVVIEVCNACGRNSIGIEKDPVYYERSQRRCAQMNLC